MTDILADEASGDIGAARAAAQAPPPEPDTWLRIVGGVVTNVEAYQGQPPAEDGVTWLQHDSAGIGWTYDGSTFAAPSPAPPIVPAKISALQATLVLNAHGLYQQALQAVTAAPLNVQLFWNRAPEWLRTDPNIAVIGGALGLSSEQVDALFIEAAAL